jgi:hypothetical protein
MRFQKFLLVSLRILVGTLILPAGVGVLLIGVMVFNAPFGYFLGRCSSLDACLLSRITSELQHSNFWKLIFAMWVCGIFVLAIQIYRDWRGR